MARYTVYMDKLTWVVCDRNEKSQALYGDMPGKPIARCAHALDASRIMNALNRSLFVAAVMNVSRTRPKSYLIEAESCEDAERVLLDLNARETAEGEPMFPEKSDVSIEPICMERKVMEV